VKAVWYSSLRWPSRYVCTINTLRLVLSNTTRVSFIVMLKCYYKSNMFQIENESTQSGGVRQLIMYCHFQFRYYTSLMMAP
jgi:hypothetical protein